MCRHANRLWRDTVVKFWRILSNFFGKDPGELGPIPDIAFSVKVFAKNVGKRASCKMNNLQTI